MHLTVGIRRQESINDDSVVYIELGPNTIITSLAAQHNNSQRKQVVTDETTRRSAVLTCPYVVPRGIGVLLKNESLSNGLANMHSQDSLNTYLCCAQGTVSDGKVGIIESQCLGSVADTDSLIFHAVFLYYTCRRHAYPVNTSPVSGTAKTEAS